MFGWTKHSYFISAGKTSEKAYNKLETLSREYGYARTQITLFLTLTIITGSQNNWWLMGICLLCLLLFTLTSRGHMKKMQTSVNQYLARTIE